MKIRNGFVSNSSSSSFVVVFDKEPENVEELKKMMFGDERYHDDIWGMVEENSKHETYKIANEVFGRMKKQATKKEMIESVANGLVNYREINKFEDKNGKVDWDKVEKEEYRLGNKKITELMNRNKDKAFYVFSFSDNRSSFEAVLEHTYIFKKLEYIQTSNH